MTMDRTTRVDRVLPELFTDLAAERNPAYLEAAIQQASSRPQRPAWTFPGRWIPMDISTRVAPAPRMPLRTIGVVALIALLLATTLAVYIGQQGTTLPAPFGPAANGILAMERKGDIVAVDPATGTSTPLITGPETDFRPAFSPDGSKLAFERSVDGPGGQRLLMVANADGSDPVQATPESLGEISSWQFSPDGRELLVSAPIDNQNRLAIFTIDGSHEPRILDVSLPANPGGIETPGYRPPDGGEILVMTTQPGTKTRGIYIHDVETGQTRPVYEPSTPSDVYSASWSPDGAWISFGQFLPVEATTSRVHVVAANGSGDRLVDAAPGTYADLPGAWSNDSTRLIVTRLYDDKDQMVAVVGIDPGTPAVELDCMAALGASSCPGTWSWSPDDKQLLGVVGDDQGANLYLVADPATGAVSTAPLEGLAGHPSWQRVASPD